MIRFTLNLPDSFGPRLSARLKATGHKKVAYARWVIARDLGLAPDDHSQAVGAVAGSKPAVRGKRDETGR